MSKRAAVKAVAKVTPKATRVASFIVMWAAATLDERIDPYSITEYQRYWIEGERQTYRLQGPDLPAEWPHPGSKQAAR